MISPTLLWLIAGSILCLMEFFFPTAFVAFMMGISAFLVAVVSLIVPQFTVQVVLWLAFSTLLIVLFRRYFTPKQKVSTMLLEEHEGETLTEILPGKTGRVLYEGNSWRAKCADEHQAISAEEKVFVVRQQGTTLIVLPQKTLPS
ncbi:MAG: NfeD family protein [Moorea sp. SIO2B7]|nr:NfeD family protein [Moorena sp. SIO2B7]